MRLGVIAFGAVAYVGFGTAIGDQLRSSLFSIMVMLDVVLRSRSGTHCSSTASLSVRRMSIGVCRYANVNMRMSICVRRYAYVDMRMSICVCRYAYVDMRTSICVCRYAYVDMRTSICVCPVSGATARLAGAVDGFCIRSTMLQARAAADYTRIRSHTPPYSYTLQDGARRPRFRVKRLDAVSGSIDGYTGPG